MNATMNNWFSVDGRLGATARAAFKRACRRAGVACDDPSVRDVPKALAVIATERPDVAADCFVRLCQSSADWWEKGNNSGDSATLTACEIESQLRSDAAECVAALFGCACTWPGLYPVIVDRGGREEYGTLDPAMVARAFGAY